MGESFYINEYVHGGAGNLQQIMNNKMIFWTWQTKEVQKLIEWMHDYNQGKPPEERLYYIGIDSQFMRWQPNLIENYFKKTKPEFLSEVNSVLSMIRELGIPDYVQVKNSYENMSLTYKKNDCRYLRLSH